MSELSKRAREQAKSKVSRLVAPNKGSVDASGWREPIDEKGTIQTGPRPISRRAFKSGGKVSGDAAMCHAGRKPRKSGGALTADSLINRNVKTANEEREGEKHIGGMKRGGRTHKLAGGPLMQETGSSSLPPTAVGRASGGGNWIAGAIKHPGALHKELGVPEGKKIPAKTLNAAADKGGVEGKRARLAKTLKGLHKASGGALTGGTRPEGGRMPRASGGRAKKAMNVNIIIAPAGGGAKPPMPMPPPGASPGPVGLHQAAPPPPMAGVPAPMGMPPMARRNGGRTNYPIDAGAGGGLGRLEKIKAYG